MMLDAAMLLQITLPPRHDAIISMTLRDYATLISAAPCLLLPLISLLII